MGAFCDGRYAEKGRPRDLAVVVAAPVEYEPRDFVLHLYSSVCQATIDYVRQHSEVKTRPQRIWSGLVRRQPVIDFGRTPISQAGGDAPMRKLTLENLESFAQARRRQVRYLQSHTGETTGKLDFKLSGIEMKTSTTLEEQPLTYPEIVDSLRVYLATIAGALQAVADRAGDPAARVVIGIDELDRIGTADAARRFLNEPKAIFGVPNCFFLVSVSEDALRSFELAGVGLRDVFDSAFDEVVRIDYLDLPASNRLLRERIVGLSEQFLALAFCQSGGLPRELIRSARAIVACGRRDRTVTLTDVAGILADDTMARVCQAARAALANLQQGNDPAALRLALDDLPAPSASTDQLLSFANRLREVDTYSEKNLARTVGTHAYFVATLRDVFNDGLSKERFEWAVSAAPLSARLETIARIRRYLGPNNDLAWGMLDQLRAAWKLTSVASSSTNGAPEATRPTQTTE